VLRSKGDALREQICEWLFQWFSDRRKSNERNREKLLNTNYLDAGFLTSLEVIEFVTEIEGRFSIHFSEADFQDPRFVTVSGLSDLILERQMETGSRR
jgi:acyl carrier protein